MEMRIGVVLCCGNGVWCRCCMVEVRVCALQCSGGAGRRCLVLVLCGGGAGRCCMVVEVPVGVAWWRCGEVLYGGGPYICSGGMLT